MAPRPQKWPGLAKNTPSQNHLRKSMFRSVRGSDSCHIGNQQLCFHWMTLGKGTRAQEDVPTSQSGSVTLNLSWIGQKNWPSQSHPRNNTFCSARGSESCHIGNQPVYFSIKRPWVKLLEVKIAFLHYKGAPQPQNSPVLTKKTQSHNSPPNNTFCSVRRSDSCYIRYQPVLFH